MGEPRSFSLKFEFKENEWFEDKVLEKKFYHRRTKHGEIVLRSTPVKIHWKTKDLTEGLTDAAFALWEAEQRNPDKDRKELKEYKHAKKMVEGTTEGAQSFFALFGYRGPSVSDEESREADAKFRRGESFGPDEMEPEKLDESLEAEEDVREEMETEVFGDAAELAMGLAEDLWPHALKYFGMLFFLPLRITCL